MPDKLESEIKALASNIQSNFSPPKVYQGCQVKDITDIDEYAVDNGWIEALVHEHNQQRVRYRGIPAGVGTADLIDVVHYPNVNRFVALSAGGTTANPVNSVKVSKLVSPDLSIDPVIAADNNGDLTAENDLSLGDTARGNIFANWHDYTLIEATGSGSHYNDNDSSFPAEFTEVSAPQATNTNNIYGFWYLQNNVGTGSWKYRMQGDQNGDSQANLTVGPIMFRDGQFTADIDYYWGLYRDNSGIDENTFNRVHLQWDSAGTQWRIRGEVSDGTTQTNSSWIVFTQPLEQPIWARVRLAISGSNIQTRSFFGATRLGNTHSLFQTVNIGTASVQWGTVWYQYHETRGAGVQDFLYIGGHDTESAA